jgi:hypothetical protein
MLKKSLLWIALLTLPAIAAAPLKLLFTKGETIRYKVDITSSETTSVKGDTAELRMTGSHVMTMKVSSVANGVATMSVGYSNATASATAVSLPAGAKKDKAKIETAAANALKSALSTGARSQKVKSNGSATYTMKAGEGQSLTIEGGAFMMLVLPTAEPALNKPWTANIRQPMPGSPALPVKFKWVGNVTVNGRPLKKIMISMSQSKSDKQGEISLSMTETANGFVLFDSGRGKVMSGEIERAVKQTVKHETEGSRVQEQSSKQTFTKF